MGKLEIASFTIEPNLKTNIYQSLHTMKSKIRFISALIFLSVTSTMLAQNANRTGIFIEVGAGYSMGNTPMINASVSDETVHFDYTDGTGIFLDGGWRQAMSAHSALEAKIQLQFNYKNTAPTTFIKFMPGYKFFFSNKGFKNLYLGANIGVAIGSSVAVQKYSKTNSKYDTLEPAKAFDDKRIGLAYSTEIGYNLTSDSYIALSWEGQYIKQSSPVGYSMRNWGLIGAKFGYKFNM